MKKRVFQKKTNCVHYVRIYPYLFDPRCVMWCSKIAWIHDNMRIYPENIHLNTPLHPQIKGEPHTMTSLNALSLCLPSDCNSAFRPPRAAPAAALFTADCATAPAALTNERPIILWGVSRLMAAAAAHSPADNLAPPSEGAGRG